MHVAAPPLLETRNLCRAFTVRQGLLRQVAGTVRAVDDVSLRIERGETLGLVGESGCGKSTLGRLIAGLLPPSSGDIQLDGLSLCHETEGAGRAMGPSNQLQMIFQDPFSSLNPRLTVGHSVGEPLLVRHLNAAERRQMVVDMLERVGLSAEHADRYPHEFSGGQRQRLAIARALITNPELIICDEPVSALDASVQAQVINLLQELQRSLGVSYLFISHDLGVVGHMSDRVAVMYLGRVVEEGLVDQLFTTPSHPYTRLLMAAMPRRDPAARAALATPLLANGEPPSPLAPPTGCAFHPRCPHTMDICRCERPLPQPVCGTGQEGHSVCCFLQPF